MKIIGKTATGYMVDITEEEIANAMGFGSTYSENWKKASVSIREPYSSRAEPGLANGAVINVRKAFTQVEELMAREAEVKKSAATLRALADLIDRGVQGLNHPASNRTGEAHMTLVVRDWNDLSGQPISEAGIWKNVPSSLYHSGKLCSGPSISSSGLRTIFCDSPMDYWINSALNPKRIPQEEGRHFIIGRCAHILCLGEEGFNQNFVVQPEEYIDEKTGEFKKWNGNANVCKRWAAEQKLNKLEIITPKELEMIKGLAGVQPWQDGLEDSGLMNSAVVRAGALHGLVEHTVTFQDPETGTWLLARPDVIGTGSAEISDFKTTQSVGDWDLINTLDAYRYDMQLSLISRCMAGAANIELTNFALIFACKAPPHEVAVRELKHFDLQESALDLDVAIRTFALCLETGRWPGRGGGEDDARYLERTDKQRERAADRRAQLHRYVFGS